MLDVARSNSLTDLAARIKAEHQAVSIALKDSVRHAITAGEMLIEAKEQLKHGEWLPWLRDHCTISERTAQLYMRTARNREAIEANTQSVADLTLSEAAAMLALTSDIKKLFAFVREANNITDHDEFISLCAEHNIAVLHSPFGEIPEPTPQELVEWGLFQLFLVHTCAFTPENASVHMEWVQSRGTLLKDWMGPVGIKFERNCGTGPNQKTVDAWQRYLAENQHRTLDDITAEFKRIESERLETLSSILKAGKLNGRKLSRANRQLIHAELDRYHYRAD